ncbi:MAG TPA: tetratricopeptide repeat-containing protein [Solirubrobacterales bacterium]|nr:tetratricopeptide repeat-containing protein [Solirubrobacterales bacterium]
MLIADRRLAGWDVLSVGYATGPWMDIIGVWRADPNVATIAGLLRTTASLTLKRYARLAVIAHSMGGLVLQKALVDDAAFAARVGHAVCFGTPSNGLLKAAFFKLWKPQIENMAWDSDFILDLRKRWKHQFGARPFEFLAIAGDQDQFVPVASSHGPFPPELCRVVPGNHLTMVKPASGESLSVQLVLDCLIGRAAPAGPANAARAAVERGEFYKVVNQLEPQKDELDETGLVQLALALEGVGRQKDAIAILEKAQPDYTDAVGVLAGRLKRRWLVERRARDAEKSYELYSAGLARSEERQNHSQAFYHGINIAFLELAYKNDPEAARNMAQRVLAHCQQARLDKWRLATEAEAHLVLEEEEEALARYQSAVENTPLPTPREIDSMYQQAFSIASVLGDEMMADRLRALFRSESRN